MALKTMLNFTVSNNQIKHREGNGLLTWSCQERADKPKLQDDEPKAKTGKQPLYTYIS
jgi:hypothetical protein